MQLWRGAACEERLREGAAALPTGQQRLREGTAAYWLRDAHRLSKSMLPQCFPTVPCWQWPQTEPVRAVHEKVFELPLCPGLVAYVLLLLFVVAKTKKG